MQDQTNNFRIYYQVTTPCTENPFDFFSPSLTVANPADVNNPTSFYSLIQDSSVKVTGVIDPCIDLPAAPCYTTHYYHADVSLGPSNLPYTASVANCCRPITLENILSVPDYVGYQNPPPSPGVCPPACGPIGNGIVSFARISPFDVTNANSSPQFPIRDTILYVCRNSQFSYTMQAIDPDGDSLAFHLSAPHTVNFIPHGLVCTQSGSNFPALLLRDGYSDQWPAGSSLSIDPVSGAIQGTLPDTGVYLISVDVPEYRNGQLLDSVSHDFYIHVFDCSLLPKPHASLPDSVNDCNSLTVAFPNNSQPIYTNINWNYSSFLWTFGDGDSSTQTYPVHSYADTGTYNVRLIIFPGLHCADTAYSKAVVYPSLTPEFTYNDSCSQQVVQFSNTSVSTGSGSIVSSHWAFYKDSTEIYSSDALSPTYTFTKAPETYLIYLTVKTGKGCLATDSQYVNIWQSPYPLSSHDTILSRGATLQLKANDGNFGYDGSFLWWPDIGLSNPAIADPVLSSTTDTTYYVTMTNRYGCTLTDSIRVKYYTGPELYVPNAFTPNGDGRNDIFRPVPVGISSFHYFRVFSRYGQLMYETTQPFAGWDGNYNGKPADAGTYVWEVSGTDYLSKPILKKGTVILVR